VVKPVTMDDSAVDDRDLEHGSYVAGCVYTRVMGRLCVVVTLTDAQQTLIRTEHDSSTTATPG